MVIATIDALHQNGIVEVWSVGKGKGKHANYYRLNYEKFKEYEQYSMDELKNPSLKIQTVKEYNQKGYSPSYLKSNYQELPKESQDVPQELPKDFPTIPQITNNIDNIETIDIINNKEDIEIKDNIVIDNNINKEDIYCQKILELTEKGYSWKKIFYELASTDWECYNFCKNSLKKNQGTRSIWRDNLEFLRELNEKYAP